MLDTNIIIDRIVAGRKALGWSQRQFAANVGVSFEYVNRVKASFSVFTYARENGRSLGVVVARYLSRC